MKKYLIFILLFVICVLELHTFEITGYEFTKKDSFDSILSCVLLYSYTSSGENLGIFRPSWDNFGDDQNTGYFIAGSLMLNVAEDAMFNRRKKNPDRKYSAYFRHSPLRLLNMILLTRYMPGFGTFYLLSTDPSYTKSLIFLTIFILGKGIHDSNQYTQNEKENLFTGLNLCDLIIGLKLISSHNKEWKELEENFRSNNPISIYLSKNEIQVRCQYKF